MVNTACSGSTAAIGLAQTLVESGRCDLVITGGADALALSNFAGFSAIKVVSPEKIAPFSTPEGMNIGEGAAFWVVENLGKALLRSAECKCKIIGHATTADAHHPTQPDPRGDGVYRTLRDAAADAGVSAGDLGCINAHGSGTSANDRAESKGIKKFLGETAVPVTSTKSYMGHCMGATGILEATCQILSMNADFVPPTLRNSGRRAGCEISALAEPLRKKYDCFISANYAFGGNNAAVVISKRDFISEKPARDYGAEIAITGLGVVSPLGTALAENVEALAAGVCAVSKIGRFECLRMGGLVPALNPRTLDRRVDFSGMNNISLYSTLAAKRALRLRGRRAVALPIRENRHNRRHKQGVEREQAHGRSVFQPRQARRRGVLFQRHRQFHGGLGFQGARHKGAEHHAYARPERRIAGGGIFARRFAGSAARRRL